MPLWMLHGSRREGRTAAEPSPRARRRRRPSRRAGLIAGVALAHLLLLAWLSESTRPTPPPPRLTIIGMTDGARLGLPSGLRRTSIKPPRPPQPPPTPAPAPPPPAAPPRAPLIAPTFAAAPDPTIRPTEIDAQAALDLNRRLTEAGAAGAPLPDPECGISGRIATALQADAAVGPALDGLPAAARSVSGAVLIWNRTWIEPELIGGPGVRAPIEAGVVRSLSTVAPDCLRREVQGPRFLVLESRRGQTILAIGSGSWRWSDLLGPSDAPQASPLGKLF